MKKLYFLIKKFFSNKHNKNRFFTILFAILFTFVVASFVVQLITTNYDYSKSKLTSNNKIPYNTGWYNKYEKNVTLDNFGPKKGFSTRRYSTYYHKIDYNVTEGSSLCFRTASTDVKLYIDGKLILDTPYKHNPFAVDSSGSIWHFYKFNTSDIGKTLTIRIRPFYKDNSCYITNMFICDSGQYIYSIISENALFFIFSLLLIVVGIVFFTSSILIASTQHISSNSLMYIGCFSMALGIYTATSTHLLELIFNNSQAIQTLACMSLYMILIPSMLFVDNILDLKPKKLIYFCQFVNILTFAIALSLQLIGIGDFHETLILSHINTAICIISVVILCIIKFTSQSANNNTQKENIKNEKINNQNNIVRIIIFTSTFICICIDLFMFANGTNTPGLYSSCNMIVIIIYLACISIDNLFSLSNTAEHAKFVKELAYKDGLTNIGNRTAYMEKIQHIQKNIESYKTVGIIIFDVNNLKSINDSLGHITGDELIIDTANLIKQSFTEHCTLFRIGGDEFAVVIEAPNSEAIYKVSVMQFNVNVHNHNMFYNKNYKVSIAHGSAFYRSNKSISLDEVIKMADKNMYENKQNMKNTAN